MLARSLRKRFAGIKSRAEQEIEMNLEKALRRLVFLSFLLFVNLIVCAAQPSSLHRLPAGTKLKLKLDADLSSKVASVNDTFVALVTMPLKSNDSLLLPAGATIEGRVTGVSKAALFGRDGELNLVFENLKVWNSTRRIEGKLINADDKDHRFWLLACLLKGREFKLKKDVEFEIELKRDVILPVLDF